MGLLVILQGVACVLYLLILVSIRWTVKLLSWTDYEQISFAYKSEWKDSRNATVTYFKNKISVYQFVILLIHQICTFVYRCLCFVYFYGNWYRIKNLRSLVRKADRKTVQLDLLGVAVVFFSLSLDFKFVFLSYFQRPLGQHALKAFVVWLVHFVWVWWSHQDPSVSLYGAMG